MSYVDPLALAVNGLAALCSKTDTAPDRWEDLAIWVAHGEAVVVGTLRRPIPQVAIFPVETPAPEPVSEPKPPRVIDRPLRLTPTKRPKP